MNESNGPKAFSYVLVSSVPLDGGNAVGIGVIFKDENRSTVAKVSQALAGVSVEGGVYQALIIALEEAIRRRVGRCSIYVDSPAVLAQLGEGAWVPRELLGAHLQVRALMNAAGRVNLRLARAGAGFSARALAREAVPAPRPSVRQYGPLQLRLINETART